MIYKKFGSTGINISAIGFGAMRFDNPDDIDTSAALIKAAYDAGINYFDTGPGYCEDKSEAILGAAIKQMLKSRTKKPFYISTKSAKDHPGELRRQLENSLKILNLDYIDFYHAWCVITLEEYQKRKVNGVIKEFEKLRDEGLIKHISVSTHLTGSEVEQLLKDYPFESVLLGFSVMNFAFRDAGLDAAARLKRGVVVMNPLGGGLIPEHPKIFEFVKTREDETVVEGALHFLINDPRISSALVGFSNKKQLDEAIRAVDSFELIDAEKITEIRRSIKESFNELCTGCRYCDNCPEGVSVPKMMDVYNHYLLSDKIQDVIDRLRYHWGISLEDDYFDKCKQCGHCEQACTQRLPICNRLEVIRDEVKKYLAREKQKK